MSKKRGLGFGEKLLLLFACGLTLGSLYFYVNNKELQTILLSGTEETQSPIGKLQEKNGTIKRETLNDSGFSEISENAILYNNDTILTSQDSSAVLKLNDDGEFKLSPNTMIRLNLDSTKDQTGIYRTYQIEILNGEVSAQSEPSNEKTKVFLKSKNENIKITKGQVNTLKFKKEIPTPKTEYPDADEVKIITIATPTPVPSPIPTTTPTAVAKLPPKAFVAKAKANHNAEVKPLVLPPEPKCPVRGLIISIKNNVPDQNGRKEVFLTWKRQAVENYYEVQIASDKDFRSVVDSHQSQSNFYAFTKLSPGIYWWRLKTMNKIGTSAYSGPTWFQVMP